MVSCSVEYQPNLSSFNIEDGFEISLVAQEPLIFDPVDLEFNEKGEALVLEMPGYPLEGESSRIVLLEDKDQNGTFDHRIVFADNLRLASSILPYRQGILVAAPPYLLHLKDLDNDSKADQIDTLMGGFSEGNLQHNFNGLTYSIDNWIYAANGGNSGKPFWWGDTSSVINLHGEDLRFHLENKIMQRIGNSSGGFELAMDEWGRLFETHNLEHVSMLVFPGYYIDHPVWKDPNTLINISDHDENGLARIFPIGEQESRVNHPEQSGYFSGACGITYYGGNTFGPAYDRTLWVNDVVLNLIHVDKLNEQASKFEAQRQVEHREFLASTDRSFRPVNMTVGPDGHLYVVDMYRDVIEHPEWIPDEMEAELDLDAGKDKGRLYKIYRSDSYKETFDKEHFTTTEKCIKSLSHPNQWTRTTAHRLLLESALKEKEFDLLHQATLDENAFARLHSRWVLNSLQKLTEDEILQALQDKSAGNLENALIMAEEIINNSDQIVNKIIALLIDQDQRVRMQSALALSKLSKQKFRLYQEQILLGILQSMDLPFDQWNASASALAMKYAPDRLFQMVTNSTQTAGKNELLPALAYACGKNVDKAITILKSLDDPQLPENLKCKCIAALEQTIDSDIYSKRLLPYIENLEKESGPELIAELTAIRKKINLPNSPEFGRLSKSALKKVLDNLLTDPVRLEQFSLIEYLPYQDKSEILFQCLEQTQPLTIQQKALEQLNAVTNPEIGSRLVQLWPSLGPQIRKNASDILLFNRAYHDALLTGLESGNINIGEMNFDLERRRTLLWWTDNEDTKRRAIALFSDAGVSTRKEAMHKMEAAIELTGSSKTGHQVFERICATCHQFGNMGHQVGPNLTEISRKSKATLMHDILDPNAAVETKYISHKIETFTGAIHIGIIESESNRSVHLKKTGGELLIINKSEIKDFKALGSSLMMEGLENSMTHQDLADLLAFLQKDI